jgi:tetratricopeptide (TPR) repeat protein
MLCAVCIAGAACAIEPLPADMHAWGLASVDHVFREQFREAESEARRIIRKYPEHPAGYFFLAAVLDARMKRSQSDDHEVQFYHFCDEAIVRGERLLEKNSNDYWARFFIAGANGAKGAYESRYGRWITAFRHGWQGVAIFKEIQQAGADIPDVLYGIATYDFWRSAMTQVLWWMPGVEDRRDEAIEMLFEACTTAIYVGPVAQSDLVEILNYQQRHAEALAVANALLKAYPGNLTISWGKGEALLGSGNADEAEKMFQWIRQRIAAAEFGTNYNLARVHYFLARVYLAQEKYADCFASANAMHALRLSSDDRKRLEKQLDEANAIKKRARGKMK